MARGHVILFPVKHHLAAQFVCPCLILAGQHLEQSVVSHTITHGFQADGAVNPSVARIDYPTVTARQYKSASLSVSGFMPGVSISPPLIEAPMQIARSTVLVVQPVENASLQQRLLYEAVGKLTLREDTGVEPHLIACLLAFTVEAMAVSIVVQLRHPDVEELSQVVGVAGFDGWNLWCQGLEETAYVQIGGRVGGDGFVSDMLIVYLVPSFFAQMGGQGWDEMPQIVLRPLVFDGKQAAYPRHSYAKRIVPSSSASAKVSALYALQHAALHEDVHHLVEVREVERPAVDTFTGIHCGQWNQHHILITFFHPGGHLADVVPIAVGKHRDCRAIH